MLWSIVPQATYFSKEKLQYYFEIIYLLSSLGCHFHQQMSCTELGFTLPTSSWLQYFAWGKHNRVYKFNDDTFDECYYLCLSQELRAPASKIKTRTSFCRLIPRCCGTLDSPSSVPRCKCLRCQQMREDLRLPVHRRHAWSAGIKWGPACGVHLHTPKRYQSKKYFTSKVSYAGWRGSWNEAWITQCQ